MINTQNLEQAKLEIKKSTPPITIQAQSLEFNRKILEYGKFQSLNFPTKQPPLITLKKINPHIDLPAVKAAKKNNITIAFDISQPSGSQKQKALCLAQLIELIKLTKKSAVPLKILNYKDARNIQALLQSLGASSQQAKQVL